jgi:hypothetical protein
VLQYVEIKYMDIFVFKIESIRITLFTCHRIITNILVVSEHTDSHTQTH